MKKICFFFYTLLLSLSSLAQQSSDYVRSIDKETGQIVMQGQITPEDLLKEPSFNWLANGMKSYHPDSVTLKYLQQHLKNYKVVVVLGTWCDDSHRLIPQLLKLFSAIIYPTTLYQLYGVNREKEAKYVEHKIYRITKVPTIILYRGPMEIGRIVESTTSTLEGDMAALIREDIERLHNQH